VKKLALLALLAAAPAAAQQSARGGSFDIQIQSYRPNIDAEFANTTPRKTPYQDVFGDGRSLVFQVHAARSLFTQWGSLDLGIGIGWSSKTAKGFIASTAGSAQLQRSNDNTSLRVLPLNLSLTYRMDWFVDHGGFPIVPYGKVAFERWQWWVTNGSGGTAKTVTGNRTGSGATSGWSAAVGVAVLLDFIDPGLAREMDRDTGINHTYVFVEGTKTQIDDFGSKKSWDLSNDKSIAWSGGLLFVF
jgi:hypothetical protein